jgi:hypothetical protein
MNIPDDSEVDAYLYGKCYILALVLHRRFGWKCMGMSPKGREHNQIRYIWHAFVINDQGLAVDIRGVHATPECPPGYRTSHLTIADMEYYEEDPNMYANATVTYGLTTQETERLVDRYTEHFTTRREEAT